MASKISKGKNSNFAIKIQNAQNSAVAVRTIKSFNKSKEELQNFDFADINYKNAIADFKSKISSSSAANLLKYATQLNLVREAKLVDKEISDKQKQSFEGKAGFKGLAIFILIKIAQTIDNNYEGLEEVLGVESLKESFDQMSLEEFKGIVNNLDDNISIVELYELVDEEQIPNELLQYEETVPLPQKEVQGFLPQLPQSSFIEMLGGKERLFSLLEAKSIDDDYSYIYEQAFDKFKELEVFKGVNQDLLYCNDLAKECFLNQNSKEQKNVLETAFVDYYQEFISDAISTEFSELFQELKDTYNNTDNRAKSIDSWVKKYCKLETSSKVGVVQESQLNCQQIAQSIEAKFNEHYNIEPSEIGNDAMFLDDVFVE